MDLKIMPGKLSGKIPYIPSKSHLHRLIIAEALSGNKINWEEFLEESGVSISEDIKATAYGVGCIHSANNVKVDCNESGSTLRLLLPVMAVLFPKATFKMAKPLGNRPLSPLTDVMKKHGCRIEFENDAASDDIKLFINSKMSGGRFFLPGNISSQFVSGLLFALPLTDEGGEIILTTPLSSEAYVKLTINTLEEYGIDVKAAYLENTCGNGERNCKNCFPTFSVKGKQNYISPMDIKIQRDWSNTAFWLVGEFIGHKICINLENCASAPDMEILNILDAMKDDGKIKIDCDNIPDLVPILCVAAAFRKKGAVTSLENLQRLRFKESDRIKSSVDMISSLGGDIQTFENTIIINSKGFLLGGCVDSYNDHRIAMAAAIAASKCNSPTIIKGAEAVSKSYPDFFRDFVKLGGNIVEL